MMCAFAVRCVCVVRHAEKSRTKTYVCSDTPPCAHAKCLRVYQQHVHMYKHMWTSVSLRASTRFSPDVVFLTLRSPSFKSQHWSYSNHFQDHGMYTDTYTLTYTYTYTRVHIYTQIHNTHKDTHIHAYSYKYTYFHTNYHESSRTQPQLEWKCDVSVLCVIFV